ncbi:radical SAM protein [uncultured Desulfobacter sp.]|uniref:radical SAM protein n=1 Tax=uncultured Desulfobacter sp. TaxID=240139 RepID=UPI002AAAECB7|nr:radical SAM protein [uncultured Desulfobacter sp.]
MNESRPGVCSKVLTPAGAADRAASYLQAHPETSVVGFAGPGDPLANEETFETMALLAERDVHPLLCLSTNGLYLPENIQRLTDLGVQYLTVTVNAASLETAEQIYPWVNYHGNLLHGREAARLLMDGQQTGIRKAAEAGFHIKVNMVLLDGINTDEVLTLAKLLSSWGAERMNINSVINVTGQDFIHPVHPVEVRRLREEASKYIPQMRTCAQCRADAAGIPGAELTTK